MGAETYDELVERGVELAEKEKYAEAVECLKKAIELDDERLEAHYNLAVIYGLLAMGDIAAEELFEDHVDEEILFQNAVEEYQRVLEIEPGHIPAHNNLATVFALHGERDLAIQELETSLELDPDQPEVREQLEDLKG